MLFRRGGARIQWLLTERGESRYLWWEWVKRRRIPPQTLDTLPQGGDRVSGVRLARASGLPNEAVHLLCLCDLVLYDSVPTQR